MINFMILGILFWLKSQNVIAELLFLAWKNVLEVSNSRFIIWEQFLINVSEVISCKQMLSFLKWTKGP